MTDAEIAAAAGELHAAALQAAITLGLAVLCLFLYRRYRKPYFRWWALAWLLYLLRLGAIAAFLGSRSWTWLYWHQVVTGWTALALLWAALVFSRQLAWRRRYAPVLLFPPVWSYVAIYRLDNFLLAAGPAVAFLSLVTLWTGWVFLVYARRVGSTGARILAAALLLWGLHHLDYPFLRARGAFSPWGYYLDSLFLLATGAGILVLVLDELRRGLGALSALSGGIQRSVLHDDGLGILLLRTLTLPAARGSAMAALRDGRPRYVRAVGACAGWEGRDAEGAAAAAIRGTIEEGRPHFAVGWPHPLSRSSFASGAALPVLRGTAPTTALVVVGDARDPFTALDETFLRALGQQIGAALDGADLYRRLEARTEELKRLSARMVEQHEEERRRLSLELHDETAQVFSAVKLQLGMLRERVQPELAESLDRALGLIDAGMRSIRNVTNDLRPSLLDDLGLVPALRSLAAEFGERCGLEVRLETEGELPPLGEQAELALFRALQEGLANVARHARARWVTVRVGREAGGVSLVLRDDGRGLDDELDFDRLEREGHLGLAGMRERIGGLGGTVELSGAAGGVAGEGGDPGGGALLRVWVPAGAAGS